MKVGGKITSVFYFITQQKEAKAVRVAGVRLLREVNTRKEAVKFRQARKGRWSSSQPERQKFCFEGTEMLGFIYC